jgi:hypothetical protein
MKFDPNVSNCLEIGAKFVKFDLKLTQNWSNFLKIGAKFHEI